jgi:RNA polymerase sigma factor (sigma-70 family)
LSIHYRNSIRANYKSLTKEMQQELHAKISKGDFNAREEVINSCLPLVYDLAKKFHFNNKHVDLEDLIQHGNVALIKAVDNWNIQKSNITTVATYYIKNAMIDLIKDSKYNIRSKYDMTKQAAEDISKIKACNSTDVETICEHTGLTKKRVRLLLGILNGKRIEYSLMDHRLHNKDNYEYSGDSNLGGCLADVIEMLDEHVEEQDRQIFMEWINFLHKNNKTRMVAEKTGVSVDEVTESVKRTKNLLKQIAMET